MVDKIEGEPNTIFKIDTRPKIIEIPRFNERKSVNIRYPLINPYSFAHIYWSKEQHELIYSVEEPKLSPSERELLRLIQLALEEMINISYSHTSKIQLIISYLEKNVQAILIELGTNVSRSTYLKLMYYLFRNSVGLNKIESLLHDYYIEDIECNGLNYPLYIVHRKFQNLRTNIVYLDPQELADFVEKLAQRCGRYVSYAKPLLDGTLPDGSRVNATYSDDVTTRGPTFTIRKFTKDPWTPVHLIKFNTASPEVLGFLWLAIEHASNIMVIGETASGKTTFLNSVLCFIPPDARICSIEDTRELNLSHDNWMPSVSRTGFGIPNMLGQEYGEVTLFDLLKESFRQNPDYVIVGEIRGKEAYVFFQGMASGHSSFGTFHAGSVETLVRRLETPPISLSASLIESLDIVCVMTHIKELDKNVRRLKEIVEILPSKSDIKALEYNYPVVWDPTTDKYKKNTEFKLLYKIQKNSGKTMEELKHEIELRGTILVKMAEKNIQDFASVSSIIKKFYMNRAELLQEYGLK